MRLCLNVNNNFTRLGAIRYFNVIKIIYKQINFTCLSITYSSSNNCFFGQHESDQQGYSALKVNDYLTRPYITRYNTSAMLTLTRTLSRSSEYPIHYSNTKKLLKSLLFGYDILS